MYPLFETICIERGKIQNIDLHQMRYERSCVNIMVKVR